MKKRLVVVACATVVLSGMTSESSPESRAHALVAQMTLEEKASQLIRDAAAISRLGVPAYNWWNEALHGVARSGLATVFPQSIGLAATFDDALMEDVGHVIGVEVRAKFNLYRRKGVAGRYVGLTLWSPNVNLFRDPRWGRGQETFGEDPHLSGKMGAAFVRGVQGNHPVYRLASACAKHFAVHSGPEKGRRGFNAEVSERALREYYLPAFRMLVDEGRVSCVMTAYNAVNGTPATASRHLLADILRGEWGYGGFVVSDVGAVDGIVKGHRFSKTAADGVAAAVAAGLDIGGDRNLEAAREAVLSGRIPQKRLDECLVRTFAERFRLGLAGTDDPTPWSSLGAADVASEAHRAKALEAAEKSLVLVSNRNGCLPLDVNRVKRLGVGGPRAFDEIALYANYNGFSDRPSTVFSGIVGEGGPSLLVEDHEFSSDDARCEVIVACIGLNTKSEGEEGTYGGNGAGDRTTIALPPEQLKELGYFRRNTKKLVAVVFGGSPLDLKPVVDMCDAVLVVWYPGEAGGRAIARTIFGRSNPSGRLPVTFPKSVDDLPDIRSYALKGRTYLYAEKEPLFPFGYGLSYSTFAYSDLRAERRSDGSAAVSARVANTSQVDGAEVVQLYVRAPESARDDRRHHLEAFRRVQLKAGAEATVEFVLPSTSFMVFDENGKTFLPVGSSTIFVGGGQPGFSPCRKAELLL